MNRFLYLICLSILLSSAICSCRSSRHSVTDYADTTSVVINQAHDLHMTDDIFSLISMSRELDLSGVRLEFFPPDSLHPNARAAPKSLTIENARAKESAEQATHETVDVDGQKTENLSAQSSSTLQKDSRSDNNVLRLPDWVFFLSIAIAIICICIFLYYKFLKKSST